MNNKGGLLSFMLSLLAIGLYIQLYLILVSTRTQIEAEGILGERALLLQQAEAEHQRINLYLDYAARKASDVSFSSLSFDRCGTYQGVPYWRGLERHEDTSYCTQGYKEAYSEMMQKEFRNLIQKYPSTALPRTFDILIGNQIVGTALSPVVIDDIMVFYPSFSMALPAYLYEMSELAAIAQDIEQVCLGQPLEPCVADYLREMNKQRTEKILIDYACGNDVKGDRSIILCKDTSAGEIALALYVGLDVPFKILELEMAHDGAIQNWAKSGQNFIVNPGDKVIVSGEVSAPRDVIVSWCVQELTCVPISHEKDGNIIRFSFDYEPQEYAKNHWLQVEMGLDTISSPTNLLTTT